MKLSSNTVYVFRAAGIDLIDPRKWHPSAGTLVKLTQPFGAPKNGTMGHCYVKNAETDQFYGLVSVKSLTPLSEYAKELE